MIPLCSPTLGCLFLKKGLPPTIPFLVTLIFTFSKLLNLTKKTKTATQKNPNLYLIQTEEPADCTDMDRNSLHSRAWEALFKENLSAVTHLLRALKQLFPSQERREVFVTWSLKFSLMGLLPVFVQHVHNTPLVAMEQF